VDVNLKFVPAGVGRTDGWTERRADARTGERMKI
jgi:hypothetical protein